MSIEGLEPKCCRFHAGGGHGNASCDDGPLSMKRYRVIIPPFPDVVVPADSPEQAAHKRVLELAEGSRLDSSGEVVTATVVDHGVYRIRALPPRWATETVASGENRDSGRGHDCG